MIAEELVQFGVSAKYVGTGWRKHRLGILDTANRDIIANLKHKLGAGPPLTVPVEELHRRVKLAPFRYCKCICVLSNYTLMKRGPSPCYSVGSASRMVERLEQCSGAGVLLLVHYCCIVLKKGGGERERTEGTILVRAHACKPAGQ